jgi:hypothetical protein
MSEPEVRYSTKRARVYKHGFDHDKARRMLRSGMTARQVGEALGVSKSAIYKMKLSKTSTTQKFVPVAKTCPRCFGVKDKDSKMCKSCDTELRMVKPKRVHHRLIKETPLDSVEFGRIVLFGGRYAVVEPAGSNTRKRKLHFWDGQPEIVSATVDVDQMPYNQWVVDE